MNEVTLKPCPFCGGEVTETRGQINAPFYFYKCKSKKCGAVVSFDNMPANLNEVAALCVDGTDSGDTELSYAKTRVDQALQAIEGDVFIPWDERYGR